MSRVTPTTCLRCQQEMHGRPPIGHDLPECPVCHRGRGLCSRCYRVEHRAGGLDRWPRLTGGFVRKECDCPGRPHRHGTAMMYGVTHKCRCRDCVAYVVRMQKVRRLNQRRGKPFFTDSTGTRRRVQALVAMGWSFGAQARYLGLSHDSVALWTKRPTIRTSTAVRVREMFDVLSMRFPPVSSKAERISVAKAKARAGREGWPVPLAWDDGAIDDPDAEPYMGAAMSAKERRAARVENYEFYRGHGLSDEWIRGHWGMTVDAFERWLWRYVRGNRDEAA